MTSPNDTNELNNTERDTYALKPNLLFPGGGVGRGKGIVREFWKVMYTLLYSKQIITKDLL